MTTPIKYMEPTSDLTLVQRRDFEFADPTILNTNSSRPLLSGEWLGLNSSNQRFRAGNNSAADADEGTDATVAPYWGDRGRTDVITAGKGTFLTIGEFEFETNLIDQTGLAVGNYLTVQDVAPAALGGQVIRGLAKEGSTSGRVRVGYVTRIDSDGTTRVMRIPSQKTA